MKTISRRFRFVAFGVIVIVAVVSCCPFLPIVPNMALYSVEIGNQQKGPKYVEWKDQGKFDEALAQVRRNPNGKICICVLKSSKDEPYQHKLSNDCPRNYKCYSENIRTVKVTKSKAANNTANGQSAANDPNVMHKIQSPDPGDISAVLKTLEL